MKVVLLQDVSRLGRAREVKEVADGYARNYLLPRKLAVPATSSVLKTTDVHVQQQAQKQQQVNAQLAELAQKIDGLTITFKRKVAAEGRLYGSVKNADIAREIGTLVEDAIDKEKVALDEPIRQLGSYEVTIRLMPKLSAKITVAVEEEAEGE